MWTELEGSGSIAIFSKQVNFVVPEVTIYLSLVPAMAI